MSATQERRRIWVDRLSPLSLFCLVLVGYAVAAVFSDRILSSGDHGVLIWLATGVVVGVATSTRNITSRAIVVAGGFFGQLVFLFTTDGTLGSDIAELAAYLIESVGAIALLSAVFSRPRIAAAVKSRNPTDPTKYLLALLVCFVAAGVAALPILVVSQDLNQALHWVVHHGIGTRLVGAAIHRNEHVPIWLPNAHPNSHRTEVGMWALMATAITILTVAVESGFMLVGAGVCVLVAARFGKAIGLPLVLLFVTIVGTAMAQEIGDFSAPDDASIQAFHGFSAAMTAMASVISQVAVHADTQIQNHQQSRERWKKLARSGFDGYVEMDRNHVVVDASETITGVLELSIDEVRGRTIRSFFGEEDWSKVEPFIAKLLAGETVRFDRSFRRPDGEIFAALALAEPVLDEDRQYEGCTIFFLDATALYRKKSEAYGSREALVAAQEAERQRLAQLVHDGALQDLAAAKLLVGATMMQQHALEIATNDGESDAPSDRDTRAAGIEHLDRIESLLTSGISKLRADAIGAQEIDLRDTDVVSVLQRTVDKFGPVNNADVDICDHGIGDASHAISQVLLQITKEALVNSIIHSNATSIKADLRRTRDGYSVAVIDNGIGFDMSRLQEVGHLGLSSMTALAFQSGGWCSFSTRPGRGTSVEAWIPERSSEDDALALRTAVGDAMPSPTTP